MKRTGRVVKHAGMAAMVGGIMMMGSVVETGAGPRTESICNFGMSKGEQGRECEVPIPSGCRVAQFPGYEVPWVDISKGGKTTCSIDEEHTDWTTRIVGSCGACGTDHCSARFSVMFNCEERPPAVQPRTRYTD